MNGCVDPTESCEPWEPPGKDCCELSRAGGRPVEEEEEGGGAGKVEAGR